MNFMENLLLKIRNKNNNIKKIFNETIDTFKSISIFVVGLLFCMICYLIVMIFFLINFAIFNWIFYTFGVMLLIVSIIIELFVIIFAYKYFSYSDD